MLFGIAVGTFLGYYFWPLGARPWAYYVATGALMLTQAVLQWSLMRTYWGRLACAYIVMEAGQQSVCGAARWGMKSTGEDLCKTWLGPDIYLALGSLAVAGLVVWSNALWRNRHQ